MNDTHHNNLCPYCRSDHIRRHGKTPKGSVRFRCIGCGKTWTYSEIQRESPRDDILASIYLQGLSYRQIRAIYNISHMRLNQRIRNFLDNSPPWEEYLDSCVKDHRYKVINLYGVNLQSTSKSKNNNNLYIALAVDAMATVVIGFELGNKEDDHIWKNLLSRMTERGVTNPRFLFDQSDSYVHEAIQKVYPDSSFKDISFRFEYDQKLQKRINSPRGAEDIMNNTIVNILSPFDFFSDGYLAIFKDQRMKRVLLEEREQVLERLLTRIQGGNITRVEGLTTALHNRVKAFRSLKEDPWPVINGWLAWYMLQNLEIGFSRLSLYIQKPVFTSVNGFFCGQIPEPKVIKTHDRLVRFVVEIATRRLQLPLF